VPALASVDLPVLRFRSIVTRDHLMRASAMPKGDPRPAIIYKGENNINGKCYVGVTVQTLSQRQIQHARSAAAGKPWPFQRAIRKYGMENFTFSILDRAPSEAEGKILEKKYVALLKPAYNATKGGDGVWGYEHTAESKAKMSKAKKGKKHGRAPPAWVVERLHEGQREYLKNPDRPPRPPHTAEAKAKIGAAGKGRPAWNKGVPAKPEATAKRLETTRARDSWPRPMKGKKISPEAIAKRLATMAGNHSKPWLGKKMTAEQRRNMSLAHSRPVICVTDGRRFLSTRDAAEFYGIHQASVANVCSNRYKAVRGLVFKRADE
jgi:group I intron endonuclease